MWKDYSLVNFLKGRSLVQLMIFIFIILCVTNFLIFQLGFEGVTQKKAIISRSFFPKGYVIGLIWTILVILQTISFKKISSQINSFLILILTGKNITNWMEKSVNFFYIDSAVSENLRHTDR